jgi:hypothetical protein
VLAEFIAHLPAATELGVRAFSHFFTQGYIMKTKRITTATYIFCCLAIFPFSKASAVPVILNPSFELPGFTSSNAFIILSNGSSFIADWSVGGQGVDYFKKTNITSFASDGQYSVNYVRGPGEGGVISTVVTGLEVGEGYELSFDVIQSALDQGTALTATVNSISQSFINSNSNVWEENSLFFIADASSANISFSGAENGAIDSPLAHIDNVSISAVPVPGAILLFSSGFLGLLGFIRR